MTKARNILIAGIAQLGDRGGVRGGECERIAGRGCN
jgi:hypothetical protein